MPVLNRLDTGFRFLVPARGR